MNVHKNPNDTFWLARYARNTLEPLIKVARTHEPSIHYNLTLGFDIERTYRLEGSALDIHVHWDRNGMLVHQNWITTKDGVDLSARIIRDFIDTEQAALEAREDAAAEAQAATELEADKNAAEARDFIAAKARDAAAEAAEDIEAFKNMTPIKIVDSGLYELLEADAAEAQDWDLKQDRIRERADIEDAA